MRRLYWTPSSRTTGLARTGPGSGYQAKTFGCQWPSAIRLWSLHRCYLSSTTTCSTSLTWREWRRSHRPHGSTGTRRDWCSLPRSKCSTIWNCQWPQRSRERTMRVRPTNQFRKWKAVWSSATLSSTSRLKPWSRSLSLTQWWRCASTGWWARKKVGSDYH